MRKRLSSDIEAEVLLLARRRCCICFGLNRDTSIKAGQIAHLDQDASNCELDNLAFLCLDHHDTYDARTSQSKGLTILEVRQFRKELHETIARWSTQPIHVGAIPIQSPDDIEGRYVRKTDFEEAEFIVERIPGGKVRVNGIAVWGTQRQTGPNIGELQFEAAISSNTTSFRDTLPSGGEYGISIEFGGGKAVATEQYAIGYFGMNVSFAGEYKRVESLQMLRPSSSTM